MKLKEYKYKINGIRFSVGVGDITDNEVYVEVNGTPYHVELDKSIAPPVSKIEKPKKAEEAPRTETGEKVIAKPVIASKAAAVKSAIKKIDQAVAKGLLHKNTAARKKSALAKKANA